MTVNDAMKRRLANMALLITGMIWGSGFVVMKNTLDSMSTNYILAIRFTIAALGLSYTLFTKGPVTFEKIKAGANLGLYIYGAFAVQTYGLMFTTAGKNALITAFYVVLVPLLLWIMQKRRPEGKVWMAAVMMIIGIALLTTDGGGSINIGDVLTLCCSLGYAIQIVLVDGYAKKYDLMQLTCFQFWFSALYGWIAALLFEQPPVNMGGDTVFALAYCGIACTLIGLTLQNVGVKYASPEENFFALFPEQPENNVEIVAAFGKNHRRTFLFVPPCPAHVGMSVVPVRHVFRLADRHHVADFAAFYHFADLHIKRAVPLIMSNYQRHKVVKQSFGTSQ